MSKGAHKKPGQKTQQTNPVTAPKEQKVSVQQETTDTPEAKTEPERGFSLSAEQLKKLFYGSLIIMLLVTWITGYNVGYHQDEMDMNNYGRANVAFYTSGGKDTSYLKSTVKYHEVDSLLRFYGSAFEYIAVGANKVTGNIDGVHEFDVRHFCNQIFAILALLFTGLIARKLIDWRAAIIAVWLAFLSPSFFGHFLFNTKDIPFAAGYIATVYYILWFLEELPKVSWQTTLKLMAAFAFTTDIRIGGVLLLFYLFVFFAVYLLSNITLLNATLKNALDTIIKLVVIIFGGLALVVISWPFLLKSPIKNLIATLDVVRKFPLKININFEGLPIDSLKVPPTYIPKFMSITAPIFVICFVLVGLAFYFVRFKKYDIKGGSLLLFTILFPVVYAVINKASLYSGWRHFLFIYPGLCIFAAAGINEVLDYLKKPAMQLAFGVVSLVAMSHPILWSIKNHPYEYCYFNEFAGGFKGAYSNYDNDYWEITVKKAMEWMMENEPIKNSKDTVVIASNVTRFVEDYIHRHYPTAKAKVIPTGVTGRNAVYWQYGVYNTLFLKPDYMENYFPPAQTIHSENIDELPVTAIIKDTARLDFKGLEALKVAQHARADSLYEAHIRNTKDNNAALFAYMSVVKGSLNKNDEAITLANRCLQYHFSTVLDYNCYCGLGIAYANKRQFDLSIQNLQMAIKIMPNENYAKDILGQVNAVVRQQGMMQPHP